MDTIDKTKQGYSKSVFFVLALVLLIVGFGSIYVFKVDYYTGLRFLLPVVLLAWVVYYWSPTVIKQIVYFLPFLFILFYAFGWLGALFFLAVSFYFIFYSVIPIPKYLKLLLLFLLIGLMIAFRSSLLYWPRFAITIPYIAAVFMFKWLIFMQEYKYKLVKESVFFRVAYFFQPANLVFVLYPITDYRKFVNAYATNDTQYAATVKNALIRLYRGLVLYLLYRIIYFYFVIPYSDVQDITSLLQYAVTGYAQILHISSIFYFAIALLGLFGFNMPDIFNFFFLPVGFEQIWSRINIYWKEFVVRLFYFPFYFKIRKIFPKNAIVIATMYAFLISILLHSYQLYWITGNYMPSLVDCIYWITIGIGVTYAANLIAKNKIKPFYAQDHLKVSNAFFIATKVVFLFVFLSFMWMLWSQQSLNDWLFLLTKSVNGSIKQFVFIGILIISLIIFGALFWILYEKMLKKFFIGFNYAIAWNFSIIAVCLLLFFSEKHKIIGNYKLNDAFGITLNLNDKQNNEQGYYDNFIESNSNNKLPWEMQLNGPKDWSLLNGATKPVNNLLMRELVPNAKIKYNNALMIMNRWGMRDKNYALKKSSNTIRFVINGGSYEVGSGVENHQIFEAITEININNDSLFFPAKIEILNMALGGYYLPQYIWITQFKTPKFKPDYVIYTAHQNEKERCISNVSRLVMHGIDLYYQFLIDIKTKSGIRQFMSRNEIKNRLFPYAEMLIDNGYKEFAQYCTQQGAVPVWIYIPVLDHKNNLTEINFLKKTAKKHGFLVFEMTNVFDNVNHSKLKVAPNDNHPNAKGHALLAKEFEKIIIQILNCNH